MWYHITNKETAEALMVVCYFDSQCTKQWAQIISPQAVSENPTLISNQAKKIKIAQKTAESALQHNIHIHIHHLNNIKNSIKLGITLAPTSQVPSTATKAVVLAVTCCFNGVRERDRGAQELRADPWQKSINQPLQCHLPFILLLLLLLPATMAAEVGEPLGIGLMVCSMRKMVMASSLPRTEA